MTESNSLQSSQQPYSFTNPTNSTTQLKRFKPWVFRPKKVIYSLEESAPMKRQFSTSHWNHEENQKYIAFLLKFREILEGQKKRRRKWHLNRIMSKFVGSRSHQQCRSHHQKMIKNYKTIDGILKHFQNANNLAQPAISDSSTPSQPSPNLQGIQEPYYHEDSLIRVLENPLDMDSEFIRIPLFFVEQSNDLF